MKTRQITEFGIMLAIGLVLSYLETFLPVFVAVPGIKIGLANLVTMFFLYQRGAVSAFTYMVLRVVLSGILFSGLAGIVYSFAGGCLCILIMAVIKKLPFFSIWGVSVLGAVGHNFGQLLIACFVLGNAHVFAYGPVLLISGTVAGAVMGIVFAMLYHQISSIFPED